MKKTFPGPVFAKTRAPTRPAGFLAILLRFWSPCWSGSSPGKEETLLSGVSERFKELFTRNSKIQNRHLSSFSYFKLNLHPKLIKWDLKKRFCVGERLVLSVTLMREKLHLQKNCCFLVAPSTLPGR